MKKLILLSFVLLFAACDQVADKKIKKTDPNTIRFTTTKIYSADVKDTLSVCVCLPAEYDAKKNVIYPVVYLLDANLYFDIMVATFNKYTEVGLLPPMILIGIGYKNIEVMDSLRNRDLTYPIAIPEYEMAVSGKGDKFLSFIQNDLSKQMDLKYLTDTTERVLMGHSLGGYFTLFALQQNLSNKCNFFKSYIAASPSTHYNHNYILSELEKLNEDDKNKTNVYITFGSIEDNEEGDEKEKPLKIEQIFSSLKTSLIDKNKVNFRGDAYSNLDHMDTGFPTFIRGLQLVMKREEHKKDK